MASILADPQDQRRRRNLALVVAGLVPQVGKRMLEPTVGKLLPVML